MISIINNIINKIKTNPNNIIILLLFIPIYMKLINNDYNDSQKKLLSDKTNLLVLLFIIIIITTQINYFIGLLMFISFMIIIKSSYIENFISVKSSDIQLSKISIQLENDMKKLFPNKINDIDKIITKYKDKLI